MENVTPTEIIGKYLSISYGIIEDYLRAADVPEDNIELIKSHAAVRSIIINGIDLAYAASLGDEQVMLKSIGAIAVGGLVTISLSAVAAPATVAVVTGILVSEAFSNSYYELVDLNGGSTSDGEFKEWFDETDLDNIVSLSELFSEIPEQENTELFEYRLNNGVLFEDTSVAHQRILSHLISEFDTDVMTEFLRRENIIRQFSIEDGEGVEDFLISIEKILYGGANTSIETVEQYLLRADNLAMYLHNNADKGWKLVETESLEYSATSGDVDGFAYRYALINLNPVAIIGDPDLYVNHNSDGALNVENFSTSYLADRASMLRSKSRIGDGRSGQLFDENGVPLYYSDKELSVQFDANLELEGSGEYYDQYDMRQIVFGGESDDNLFGFSLDDRLYGGAGDDTITGGDNNDYIEGNDGNDTLYGGNDQDILIGGAGDDKLYGGTSQSGKRDTLDGGQGNDSYYINTGDGDTKIIDSDLTGKIYFDDVQIGLNLKVRVPGRVYEEDAANGGVHVYTLSTGLLSISLANGQNIVIEGFVAGQGNSLGINFSDDVVPVVEPETSKDMIGDFAWQDFDPDQEGIQVEYDQYGNPIQDLNSPQVMDDTINGSSDPNDITSGAGDDIVFAKEGSDLVTGGFGDDQLYGGDGDDYIYGDEDSDIIHGQNGDDYLYANEGMTLDQANDSENSLLERGSLLSGGAGDDYLFGNDANDDLYGGAGRDVIVGSAGNDNIRGDSEIQGSAPLDWLTQRSTEYDSDSTSYALLGNFSINVSDQGDDDALFGGAGDDWLFGELGNDLLDGGTGNDVLLGGDGSDVLEGGVGNDLLAGDSLGSTIQGDDILHGGAGDDALVGLKGKDQLYGESGQDILKGGDDNDLLDGGDDDDTLFGGSGEDELIGGQGNDYLDGNEGDDDLAAGVGDDILFGSDGNDSLKGEDGADNLEGDAGDDTLLGGNGKDILFGGLDNDTLDGGADDDHLEGGEGIDMLLGGGGNDTLYGEKGEDILDGGTGNDYLLGGEDDDVLDGGAGDDTLWGGSGSDTFVFGVGSGKDFIEDADGTDTVRFKNGLTLSAITSQLVSSVETGETYLAINHDQSDALYIKGGFYNNAISSFQFSDGTVLTSQEFITATFYSPDPENPDSGEVVNVDDAAGPLGEPQTQQQSASTIVSFSAGSDLFGSYDEAGSVTNTHTVHITGYGTIIFSNASQNTDYSSVEEFKESLDPERVASDPNYVVDEANKYFNDGGSHTTKTYVAPNGSTTASMDFDQPAPSESPQESVTPTNGADDLDPSDAYKHAERTLSPLVLDLDGDGVETVSKADGIYFDHDVNGIAELTGWVAPDDGLLVWDRNQDGLINDGSELFGNRTVLEDGGLAANGYEALFELDVNSDGVVDNQDLNYSNLRVWQDANQDGISQQRELLILEDAQVRSLNTGYSSTSVSDGNGNTVKQVSLATKDDDSTIQTADVWFGVDVTQTVDRNTVVLSADVAALPEATAFGNVRSLSQSMMNDEVLKGLVTQFTEATTDAERLALMDDLIYQWTGSADVDPHSRDQTRHYGHVIDARKLVALENLVGRSYLGTWCWGQRDPNPHGRAAPKLIAEYQKFKSYITAQLMSQTVYQDVFDELTYTYNFQTETFTPDLTDFISVLKGYISENEAFVVGAINTLMDLSLYSTALQAGIEIVKADPELGLYALDNFIVGTDLAETLAGGNANDFIQGNGGDDTLLGGAGDDHYLFDLGDGSDRIYDATGQDYINFGDGISLDNIEVTRNLTTMFITILDGNGDPTTDRIQFDNVFDFDGSITPSAIENFHFSDGTELTFSELIDAKYVQVITDGEDQIFGTPDDETFNALHGNDTIYGGSGNDIYQFAIGDGQDTIVENSGTDTIEFINGIQPNQVKIERTGEYGDDLILHLYDENGEPTGDTIRVIKAYQNNSISLSRVEQVQFTLTDGTVTVMVLDELEKLFNVTELDDVVYGFESDDVIGALSGIDTVHGAGGADALYGDSDDDVLFGETGDDTLIGGQGNDLLNGGSGNDRYLFVSGDGHDIIDNTDSASIDVLEFDSSIKASKVRVFRVDNDLFISIDRNTDSIQVKNFFNGDVVSSTALKEIRFSDGTFLSVQDVIDLTLEATQQADYIEAFAGDDTIAARGGDDIVYGKTGDDMVSGDQGNDLLFGENGNDLLLGQQGQDQLYGGQGDDSLYGGAEEDQLYGSSGQDILYGEKDSDNLYGGSQDDTLYGGDDTDHLYGELGDDTLNGDNGNDFITGGTGDDVMSGGAGNDTYLYADGDGNDLILTSKNESSGIDAISLSDFTAEDVWLTQEGNDLMVSFFGSNGQILVEDWKLNDDAVDEIHVEGLTAYGEDLDRLVAAMATFDVQTGAGEVIPQDVKDQLQPTIVESWHG